jgi:hypothetical protein
MKKLMFLFSVLAAAIVVVAVSVACEEKPQPQEEELKFDLMPQQASDEVASFFEEYLLRGSRPSDCFFVDAEEDVCLAINSAEEFRAAVALDIELPEIDFELYTLIVGVYSDSDGRSIRYHGINIEPERNVLNLVVYNWVGILIDRMIHYYYYWGLYPKLPDNPIEVNIIRKEVQA